MYSWTMGQKIESGWTEFEDSSPLTFSALKDLQNWNFWGGSFQHETHALSCQRFFFNVLVEKQEFRIRVGIYNLTPDYF